MRILLLGGTGSLSADCAASLHARGHEIHVLTRGTSDVPAEYHVHRANRRDVVAMRAALGRLKPDVVVNFIGFDVPDVEVDHSLFKGITGQYVFISSATVYSKPPGKLPITEDAPLGNAFWDYARKKLACEQWLLERRAVDGFPVTIVRPSHTYSRRWIPNVVSSGSYNFAARLEQGLPVFVPDDGENPWTLTAASDFAEGLAGLVGNPNSIGEAFHITSVEVQTWNQIFAEIADALDVTAPKILKIPAEVICEAAPQLAGTLNGDKAHPSVFDNSKLKRFVPGFQCCKAFRAGIRESVAWLRAHPEQRRFDSTVEAQFEAVLAVWKQSGLAAESHSA